MACTCLQKVLIGVILSWEPWFWRRFVRLSSRTCRTQGCSVMWIPEVDDGNIYRNLLELLAKICKDHGFRWRFSHQVRWVCSSCPMKRGRSECLQGGWDWKSAGFTTSMAGDLTAASAELKKRPNYVSEYIYIYYAIYLFIHFLNLYMIIIISWSLWIDRSWDTMSVILHSYAKISNQR